MPHVRPPDDGICLEHRPGWRWSGNDLRHVTRRLRHGGPQLACEPGRGAQHGAGHVHPAVGPRSSISATARTAPARASLLRPRSSARAAVSPRPTPTRRVMRLPASRQAATSSRLPDLQLAPIDDLRGRPPGVASLATSSSQPNATERPRSRTEPAWGYHTSPVLKTGWATGPMPLQAGHFRWFRLRSRVSGWTI